MPVCRRCIMPAIPGLIDLDDDGVCGDCRDHHAFGMQNEEVLRRRLRIYRQRSGRYDAMVTISGGRDSAFTLLKLVRDYGLRVLAVNYRNPFTDEQADRNIARMVRSLQVDLIRFRLPGDLHQRMVRNNLRAWLHKPSAAMVPVICVGCKIIWPRIMAIARRHHIPCIVSGGNPYEYTAFKKSLLGVSPGAGLTSTYLWNVFQLGREAFGNLSYLKPAYLFHFIPWDEEEVLTRIESEIDWRPPPGSLSTWRFDCHLSHLKDLMYLITLGVTEKDDFYSRLVRDGKMSRWEALTRVEKENRIDWTAIEGIFRQLDMEMPARLAAFCEQGREGNKHAEEE